MWQFDERISSIYEDHVNKHIPNYKTVIDLTLEIANDKLDKNANICDFGSANGITLEKFYNNGFRNLYGVENSVHMREKCRDDIFKIYETIPDIKFDLIVSNWALHFNKNKTELLQSFYENLNDDCYLILSEKVSINSYSTQKYYQWKQDQNVSMDEIIKKRESLKDAMFINDAFWYLKVLSEIGFKEIEIINSYWCFNTFLCKK